MQLTQTSIIDKGLESLVGHTPLFPITRVFSKKGVKVLAKLEWMQIGGSVKSRPALNIIKEAIKSGELEGDKVLLDASSGNTAIAYAAIGARLGIPVAICIPENASTERIRTLQAHGAQLIFTSKLGGTDEAQMKARELFNESPDRYFYADQYNNPANWQAHYHGTALEIYRQTGGEVTHTVIGLGTTGTAMGVGKKLKELDSKIQLITLQPELAMHSLEGWKHLDTAIVPGIYDAQLADMNLVIDSDEALAMVKQIALSEGLIVSPSSAANLLGAIRVAESLDQGTVVTVFPDSAEKYSELLKSVF